jgi:hypothetical protein
LVNANLLKELQNVLPKGNPFALHIEYHIYRLLAFLPPSLAGEGWGTVRGRYLMME